MNYGNGQKVANIHISVFFKVRKMVAAGTRIFMPEIPGVGIIRQRYPIMPAHFEGSTTEKNLAALQVLLLTHFFFLCAVSLFS